MKKARDEKTEYGTISLPMPLVNMIKEKIKGTGMFSVSSYVAFVLRQILSTADEEGFVSKEDEAEIKKRLKSLGYD